MNMPEWEPDCGGDWTLSAPGFFATYWPDNAVSATIYDNNGEISATSGIVRLEDRLSCQSFAEKWIREHLDDTREASVTPEQLQDGKRYRVTVEGRYDRLPYSVRGTFNLHSGGDLDDEDLQAATHIEEMP
jgi:hypothetical protein